MESAASRGRSRADAGPSDVEATLALLDAVLAGIRPRDFAVRLWDGTTWGPDPGVAARFTLALRHPGSLRTLLLPPGDLTFGEAYVYDDVDVEGDIEALVRVGDAVVARPRALGDRARLAVRLLALPRRRRPRVGRPAARLRGRRHSLARDREAIAYHYDLSNDFFGLFLDSRLVYSCAYFADADEGLETAQERKLEYACRKLRLRPGERLLDVGCGWGALVVHAAERHGVDAVGITLSARQAELGRDRIEAAGLADRCRIELRDYRELDEPAGFDKIVSVGMFEHVGERLLGEYFRRAWTLLRPGGVFLNHGIARPTGASRRRGRSFVSRYVFPDGELVPLATTLAAAEEAGFEIRDVESLREHYALTLRHWVRRLEERRGDAARSAGEQAYRVWRLYLAGSAHGFAAGRLNVYQALLAKPEAGRSRLPLTRADWYE